MACCHLCTGEEVGGEGEGHIQFIWVNSDVCSVHV